LGRAKKMLKTTMVAPASCIEEIKRVAYQGCLDFRVKTEYLLNLSG